MYLKQDPGSGAKEHFFGVRVFNTNAKRYLRQTLKQCYTINKNEKKHHCKNRIMEVDLGSFTPLVFTVKGGMEWWMQGFFSSLAALPWIKRGIEKGQVTAWVRTKTNFALLRSMVLCLLVSRIVTTKHKEHIEIEFESSYIWIMKKAIESLKKVFFHLTVKQQPLAIETD